MPKFIASSIDGPVTLDATSLEAAIEEVRNNEFSDFILPIFEVGEDGSEEEVASVDLTEADDYETPDDSEALDSDYYY